jgi:hypothetical protein
MLPQVCGDLPHRKDGNPDQHRQAEADDAVRLAQSLRVPLRVNGNHPIGKATVYFRQF